MSRDRRESNRFPMTLPLEVRLAEAPAEASLETVSHNVSARGVYFHISGAVEAGQAAEIVMTLPHEVTMAGPVRVRCLGRIQRTEPAGNGRIGVMVAIERYEFLRGEGAA